MTVRSNALLSIFVAFGAVVACESSDSPGDSNGSGGAGAGATGGTGAAGATGGTGSGGATGGAATTGGAAGTGATGGTATTGGAGGGAGDASVGTGGVTDGGADSGGSVGVGDGGPDGQGGVPGADGGPADGGRSVFAYVARVINGLLLCSLDPVTGAPSVLPSSPIAGQTSLHGIAVRPDGKFLFVGADPSRIDTYPIAADGTLPAQPSSSAPVVDIPESLALDPQNRFAYVSLPFAKTLQVFRIGADTGALTPVGDALLVGPAPNHRNPAVVAAHPSGHFVYVSQLVDPSAPETDDGIRGYRVDQTTGALTELPDSPFGGSSIIAGGIVFDPDGKFLFSSGGGLYVFTVDPDSGTLTLVEGSPFTQDVASDPWAPNMAIDPLGKFVYVTQFTLTRHVSGFSIDPMSGKLQAVPGSPVTTNAPYSVAIEPSGRFLYVGGDDGTIPTFSLDPSSGKLTELPDSPFQFGGLEARFAFVTR